MHTHLASPQDPRTNVLTVAYTVPRSAVQLGCILVSEGHTTVPADLFGPPEVSLCVFVLISKGVGRMRHTPSADSCCSDSLADLPFHHMHVSMHSQVYGNSSRPREYQVTDKEGCRAGDMGGALQATLQASGG
jgi:hypothetical protein